MKCPVCKKGEVVYCVDAIITYPIKYKKVNYYSFNRNELDNSWLECTNCGVCNGDSGNCKELDVLEKEIDFIPHE